MDDRAIIYLYVAQCVLLVIFSIGCFYRIWLNHIDRRQIRWALAALGTTLALWAVDIGYRTVARAATPLMSRVILSSWHFWLFQSLTMAALFWLFLVLQKPRRDRRQAPHSDTSPAAMNRRHQ